MLKTFKFRLYPTKAQKTHLEAWLETCRELYNAALQERREAWHRQRKSITYLDQQNALPEIKQIRDDVAEIHSQVLQDVLRRLDKAFKVFFSRVKKGEHAGFPRFKGKDRYDRFTFAQSGFDLKNGKLKLSKLGLFKIEWHRQLSEKSKLSRLHEIPPANGLLVFRLKRRPRRPTRPEKPLELMLGWKNLQLSRKVNRLQIRDFSEQTKKIWPRRNAKRIASVRPGFTKESKTAAMIFVIRSRRT